METLKLLDDLDPAIDSEFKAFGFPMNSYMLMNVEESFDPEYLSGGICLNCGSTEISGGDLVTCFKCMSDKLIYINERFPYTDSMFEPLREFAQLLWKADFNG